MFDIQHPDHFVNRHLGPNGQELADMLKTIGVDSLNQLIDQTIPSNIRCQEELIIPDALSEFDYLKMLKQVSKKNKVLKPYIRLGYYPTITPSVIFYNLQLHFFLCLVSYPNSQLPPPNTSSLVGSRYQNAPSLPGYLFLLPTHPYPIVSTLPLANLI